MATLNGVKLGKKTKKSQPRTTILMDEQYTGNEPKWDAERAVKMLDPEFEHHLRKSLNYYNYHYNPKDLKKHVLDWMRKLGTYSKDQLKSFDRAADRSLPITACGIVMAARAGMPMREKQQLYIDTKIQAVIASAEPEDTDIKTPAAVAQAPTIQDRLLEKTNELIGEIEWYYDEVIQKRKPEFKPYEFLTINNVPQSQLARYESVFTERRAELELARSGDDADLAEGYSHYKTADYKRLFAFIDDLISGITQYRSVKKATKKARVKKAPSKEKLVARLKYAKENKDLKLVSINPADIVGASELWIFNVKTRKLGKYVADTYQTLSVKGTSIVNFNDQSSVAKTLRKPADQLKEFSKASKVALRTFIKDIRATEIKLNGRINADTVLLKAV